MYFGCGVGFTYWLKSVTHIGKYQLKSIYKQPFRWCANGCGIASLFGLFFISHVFGSYCEQLFIGGTHAKRIKELKNTSIIDSNVLAGRTISVD